MILNPSILVLAVFFTGFPQLSLASDSTDPEWKNKTLVRIQLNRRGDFRTPTEVWLQNRTLFLDRVRGEEVFASYAGLKERVQLALGADATEGQVDQTFAEIVASSFERNTALLILRKLVQNEGLKRGISPMAPRARVQFVVRVLLENAAIQTKQVGFRELKIPLAPLLPNFKSYYIPDEKISELDQEELYSNFKDYVYAAIDSLPSEKVQVKLSVPTGYPLQNHDWLMSELGADPFPAPEKMMIVLECTKEQRELCVPERSGEFVRKVEQELSQRYYAQASLSRSWALLMESRVRSKVTPALFYIHQNEKNFYYKAVRETLFSDSQDLSEVEEDVERLIVQKRWVDQVRTMVYELFRENPIWLETDTCNTSRPTPEEDDGWPCLNVGIESLTNALFPEKALPGQSVSSSLNNPDALRKSEQIDPRVVLQAFGN